MSSNNKVIVIGASGYLGKAVCTELKLQGYEIYGIENKTPLSAWDSQFIIQGGIKSLTSKKVDEINPLFIIHCARPTMPRMRKWGRILAAKKAYRLNKQFVHHLLHSNSKPRVVFASGTLMYGNHPDPVDEDAAIRPISYARQYSYGELPFQKLMAGSYPIATLRFPWLLGDGSWFKWFYVNTLQNHGVIPIFGKADNVMAVIDIRDAAQLLIQYAQKLELKGVFNVFSPNMISQQIFAEAVSVVFNCQLKPYQEVFTSGLEKEALEAFTSNIQPSSKNKGLLEAHNFISLHESLVHIKQSCCSE